MRQPPLSVYAGTPNSLGFNLPAMPYLLRQLTPSLALVAHNRPVVSVYHIEVSLVVTLEKVD